MYAQQCVQRSGTNGRGLDLFHASGTWLDVESNRQIGASRPSVDPPSGVGSQLKIIPVTLAERNHPFPSRTRKLSSPAPKILGGQLPGKIGRRRDNFCFRPFRAQRCSGNAWPARSIGGRLVTSQARILEAWRPSVLSSPSAPMRERFRRPPIQLTGARRAGRFPASIVTTRFVSALAADMRAATGTALTSSSSDRLVPRGARPPPTQRLARPGWWWRLRQGRSSPAEPGAWGPRS